MNFLLEFRRIRKSIYLEVALGILVFSSIFNSIIFYDNYFLQYIGMALFFAAL